MFVSLKLLALSERLALRFNLVLVSAAVAAAAGVGYTLLTGAQVPTVRSCVAALLILAGIALGRDALSMRLIATGAVIVLLFRPEALAGASFQMSFAAVTAIVALHSTKWARRLLQRRDEGIVARLGRSLLGVVATGLVVEIALAPMALFHFHRAGLYGVFGNIVAIPLTTFVIMPAEATALALDVVGVGKAVLVDQRDCDQRPAVARARHFRGERRRRAPALDARLGVRADGRRRESGCACGTRGCGCSVSCRSRSEQSAPLPRLRPICW